MLSIENLSVCVDTKQLLSDITLRVDAGAVVACMGVNGSGKSSLLNALAGHPFYSITNGTCTLNGTMFHELSPDKRAQMGIFLSQQHPIALPGITVLSFLKESFRILHPEKDTAEFDNLLEKALQRLQISYSFLSRCLHDGFSGGEKKIAEMLQILVLQPQVILLDEIDSGLDLDALKRVGNALSWYKKTYPETIMIVVTHHGHIFDYIEPSVVHIVHGGRIVHTSDKTVISKIEKDGYEQFNI